MSAQVYAIVVPPPRTSIVILMTGTSKQFTLPVSWSNGWIESHNDTDAKLGLIFGTSEAEVAALVDLAIVSTIGLDGALSTPSGVPGVVLEVGERISYSLSEIAFLPGELNSNSLIWVGVFPLGAGTLRMTKSSGYVLQA